MARIYKDRYLKTRTVVDDSGARHRVPVMRNGAPVHVRTKKWYGEFTGLGGRTRRIALCTDKQASRRALDALTDALTKAAAHMTVDPESLPPLVRTPFYDALKAAGHPAAGVEHIHRPLSEHLADWRQSLLDKRATQAYADLSHNRVRSILDGIDATHWADLTVDRVFAYLAGRRADGLSIESANHYIRRIKQFASWIVTTGRANTSPLASLHTMNARTDRRHDRRPLTHDELRRLLITASEGPERFGMTGPERMMLYRVAAEIGLRAKELRSLTWASFDFAADPPTVIVGAAYSKHRRDDTLPLRPATAQLMAEWRDSSAAAVPEAAVFHMPHPSNVSRMLRKDLQDARIEYRDDAGCVADFHALRHTFITNLARGGVHPKVAQALARHSTITLTMDRYTHTVIGEQAEALRALPDLPNPPGLGEKRTALRATGTCDEAPDSTPGSTGNSTNLGSSREPPQSSRCTSSDAA